jgi:hypothetical protein
MELETMRSTKLLSVAGLAFLPFASTAAHAAPAGATTALSKVHTGQPIIDVRRGGGHGHGHHGHGHWHGGYGHNHFRPRWYGYGAPYYYDYGPAYYDDDDVYYEDESVQYSDDDAVERCASRYRSFDYRTGTFLRNDGRRQLCPYLR